jgi:ABC-type Mn2+/Zn2+ transport system ATPase subunit
MTILQAIQTWSLGLPAWQQHAIALLYARPELGPDDFEDVFALLKATHGIPDPKGRQAIGLGDDQVAAPQKTSQLVQLAAIKNLRHVNAIAEGLALPIAPTGMTAIYGDNGVGKSGYSRVLKKACRARDQSESIRPNAHRPVPADARAQASFDIVVDGAVSQIEWTDGAAAPPELSAISIFDSRCARAYVDNRGDFAYAPYGLDILEGLAKACVRLRERVSKEQTDAKPNVDAFLKLSQTKTDAGALLSKLSASTKTAEVERLGTLSDDERERLAAISKTLAELDPKRKAAELRLKAARVAALAGRIGEALGVVTDSKVAATRALIERSTSAKKLAQAAAKRFQETPGLLDGTGGEAWAVMFRAARVFCAESHAGRAFPHLGAEAQCPLCQNELGAAGQERLAALDAFIEREAEKAAQVAYDAATAAFRSISLATLDLAIDETVSGDLEGVSPELLAECRALQMAVTDRREAVKAAAAPGGDWGAVTALTSDPREGIAKFQTQWMAAAKALDDSTDAKKRVEMEAEGAQLDARRQLEDLKPAALDAIAKFNLVAKLAACGLATATQAISRKTTELTNTMATQEVANALTAELRSLSVHNLQVVLKPETVRGKISFKLVLETEGGGSAEDILSEGEQRAIAIASFLTEVRLGGGKGGVVFDDPVSSLDHSRRERVAKRLAQEAMARQVVVFTHDIFFLNVLMYEATKIGLPPKALCLNRTPQGYGVADETLPFAGANTRERVGMLKNMHVHCGRLSKTGDDVPYRLHAREVYNHLRMAWERGIEEIVFNGVVLRFRKGIETNRLGKVAIEAEDVSAINAGMGKCSNYTGHDGAMEANLPIPSLEDMAEDIAALEAWRVSADERLKKRKALT